MIVLSRGQLYETGTKPTKSVSAFDSKWEGPNVMILPWLPKARDTQLMHSLRQRLV